MIRAGWAYASSIVVAVAAVSAPVQAGETLGGLWLGGSGNWSVPTNWDPKPLHGTEDVFALIDDGNTTPSAVNVDLNVSINAITIDVNDRINVLNGRSLMMFQGLNAPVISCTGQIDLHGTGELVVGLGAALVLNGGGTVRLDDSAQARIVGTSGAELLYNVQNTIAGAGIVGDNLLGIVNGGVIDADVFELPLVIDPGPSGLTNNGLMLASNGGRLRLIDGVVHNANGVIRAEDQSRVELEGAAILGGTLEGEGNGFFQSLSTPSTLNDVTLSAPFELGPTALTLIKRVRNDVRMDVVSDSTLAGNQITEIVVPPGTGDLLLEGAGELNMQLCQVYSGSTLASGRLINGQNHTINGDGLIGVNTVGLVNHGVIHANNFNPLVIDPPDALTVQNTGSIIASGFGGVAITGATFHNTGTLEVRDASRIALTASATLVNNVSGTLTGGKWRVIADGHPTSLALWNGTIFENNADILLSGVGSFFNAINGLGVNSGQLALRNGRRFLTTNAFLLNSGVLDVGTGCGVSVNGSFVQQAGGRLIVHVNGNAGDGLLINGPATLGGVLEVRLVGDSKHLVGQSVNMLQATSVSGSFSEVITPWGVQAQVNTNSVSIVISQVCEGDSNGDGIVNIDDLIEVIQGWDFGCPPEPEFCAADVNGDGLVNIDDLLEIVDGWGVCQ